ncbi:MAG TPA: CBS domain-containing protein [Anaerolineae bacterium]|nr:CBS domain-containing protein [Anaerolineae bacterium]
MLVEKRMSHPVVTVQSDMPIHDALQLIRQESIRRLPVVNPQGKMIGIVSERDLLHAEPSDVTSLSVWELNYLLTRITVDEVMTSEVITVNEDTPIEEAARIMADHKIGGLPVMRGEELVGIITETDLFKIFLELLGAREPGVRITALLRNTPGELMKLTTAIADIKGNIVAMGQFLGESSENRSVTLKVAGVTKKALEKAVKPVVEALIDIRETAIT